MKIRQKEKHSIKKGMLALEIILHFLQPNPFSYYKWDPIESLGVPITYNNDMILFFLCTFRLYVFIRVVKMINRYGNDRSLRIL